jgi:hypothetical protein
VATSVWGLQLLVYAALSCPHTRTRVCSTKGVDGSAANCFLVCLEHVKQLEAYTHPAQEISECVRNRDSESEREGGKRREGGREGEREGGRDGERERQREKERETYHSLAETNSAPRSAIRPTRSIQFSCTFSCLLRRKTYASIRQHTSAYVSIRQHT